MGATTGAGTGYHSGAPGSLTVIGGVCFARSLVG
jgi:hypothetical protein